MNTDIWIDQFPSLLELDEATTDTLLHHSDILTFSVGTMIFGQQKHPDHMLCLLSGTVRVQQTSESGHEIVLYRIHSGESCVLTTASLLAYQQCSAEGIAETAVCAAAIPKSVFDDLMASSALFRSFVFKTFSKRIIDLFLTINDLAFGRIDVRLAQRILELAEGATCVLATHQQLSVELGTAREVISRQLKEFQRRGWIEQTRGAIVLIDIEALTTLMHMQC